MNVSAIVSENQVRRSELFGYYNPITGEGSPIDRFKCIVDQDTSIYLPISMGEEDIMDAILTAGSVEAFVQRGMGIYNKVELKKKVKDVVGEISTIRLKYDFEFWAATCATIQNKEGEIVSFVLNYPQRYAIRELEDMRLSGIPIRIIILKARQWGGSTLVQLYMAWIQIMVKLRWNSAIVTSVENQARHIRGMFNRMAEGHPREIFHVKLKPYEGSNKNKVIDKRSGVIGIGSFEEPENLRTFTFQMLHASEVASWTETLLKKPENFVQALRAAVPRKSHTLVALESTAKGVGNFFHKEWISAETGQSGYRPIFVPWFYIEEYTEEIKDYPRFIKGMNERMWELWQEGATLEGINWYTNFMREENYDDWRMKEEMPSNAREAFQTSGHRVFPIKDVMNVRKTCLDPEFVGELSGRSQKGKEALAGLEFSEIGSGRLSVWSPPDTSIKVANRYAVFVDIGGVNPKADYSVIRVIDRYWMMEGGRAEFVATWKGHIDHDLLAWKAVQIAQWYDNALLAIEENSLDREGDGYGHFYTILDQIAEYYRNMYSRTNPDKIKEGAPVKYGFWTNHQTKNMIVDRLRAAIREQEDGDLEFVERDIRACDEMDQYENKPGNKMGAVDGAKDDMVIATAGCVWLALEYMDPPKIIDIFKTRHRSKKVIGEASI